MDRNELYCTRLITEPNTAQRIPACPTCDQHFARKAAFARYWRGCKADARAIQQPSDCEVTKSEVILSNAYGELARYTWIIKQPLPRKRSYLISVSLKRADR